MINYELSQLQENPLWLNLLRAYAEATPDEDGCLARISEAADISAEDVSHIHGKLIAFGFLEFLLTDRNEGVLYQLTPLGRQGLLRLQDCHLPDDEHEPAETDEIAAVG